MTAANTASDNKQAADAIAAFGGVWVQGSTLMTPVAVVEPIEQSEPMDVSIYRMPHDQLNPDDPNRDFDHADKW